MDNSSGGWDAERVIGIHSHGHEAELAQGLGSLHAASPWA